MNLIATTLIATVFCTFYQPLDRDSEEFKRITEFLRITHAPTHSNYTLEVLDIFSVSREGEAERFKTLDNRMMLWHGSRRTNWAGILWVLPRLHPFEQPKFLICAPLIPFCLAEHKVYE